MSAEITASARQVDNMLYCKLVRDKIPQIIESEGKRVFIDILDDESYEIFLERKLDEEVKEYHESKDVEELADILEVIIALAKLKGLSFADLVDLQVKKAVNKGSFSKKIYLIAVSEEGSEDE